MTFKPYVVSALLAVLLVAACSGSDEGGDAGDSDQRDASPTGGDPSTGEQRFPDVIDVEVEQESDGSYTFAVTISSPYDTPERYADGWRIMGPDGTVHGQHELAHDHASEQPFTRTQSGVVLPEDVDEVTVEGHDLANGYGGETVTVPVP